MNVRTIVTTLVFSLAVGQHVVSMGQPAARGRNRDLSPDTAAAPSPLGREIRRYLADLRQGSLDRAFRQVPPPAWFDSWDEKPSWPDGWDDTQPWPDGWEEADLWWEKGHQDQPTGGPAGLAISLVEVDGQYEIEAALADEQGERKFRASGSRQEIEQWLTELPPRVRKAIQRRLPELDEGADASCDDLPAD
jgi:hypothetical protein